MAAASEPAASLGAATLAGLLAEQGLDTPLGGLCRMAAGVPPETPLAQALAAMQAGRLGSVLVLGPDGAALGILTHKDVLERVTLPQRSLDGPVREVMSSPVHTLRAADTLHQAALLMDRYGIQHVPITQDGRVVGLLSGKDVQSAQRHALGRTGSAIAAARSVADLVLAAADVRTFAADLLAHDVGAREVTELISQLNDSITRRMLQIAAAEEDLDLAQACWLAFGSQGRSEQTIMTDQDNGLVFDSADPARDRARWLALGQRVNQGLGECGFTVCKGQVMAANPACCLTVAEWCGRFAHWIEHGSPEDLLKACIYFDLRPVAGRAELAQPLRELVRSRPAGVPRFLKQMADNALANPVPLNWLGNVETRKVAGRHLFDLKHHGTMAFVDAARLYALEHGIEHTSTCRRLGAVAVELKVPAHESEAWVRGFEYLQLLRLRTQAAPRTTALGANTLDVDSLNDIDRHMLKEALRVARRLQQRMELDFDR